MVDTYQACQNLNTYILNETLKGNTGVSRCEFVHDSIWSVLHYAYMAVLV